MRLPLFNLFLFCPVLCVTIPDSSDAITSQLDQHHYTTTTTPLESLSSGEQAPGPLEIYTTLKGSPQHEEQVENLVYNFDNLDQLDALDGERLRREILQKAKRRKHQTEDREKQTVVVSNSSSLLGGATDVQSPEQLQSPFLPSNQLADASIQHQVILAPTTSQDAAKQAAAQNDATEPLGINENSDNLRGSGKIENVGEDSSSGSVVIVLTVLFICIVFCYRKLRDINWRRLGRALWNFTSKERRKKRLKSQDSNSWPAKKKTDALELASLGRYLPQAKNTPATFHSILSPSQMQNLHTHLPRHLNTADWHLVYSTEVHGYSLNTAYSKLDGFSKVHGGNNGVFIAVMDENQFVFGGFCDQWLGTQQGYFGSGSSFVCRIHPQNTIHKWTQKNSQFVLARDEMIGFGGGGRFALWLDSAFERGTSEAGCVTFDNPMLSSVGNFKCISVEMWGFVNSLKPQNKRGLPI